MLCFSLFQEGWQKLRRGLRGDRGRLGTRVSGVLLGCLLVWGLHQSLLGAPTLAQTATQATVTEITGGNQVYIQDRQAQVNSIARQQQRVRTAASQAALLFNTGAVARLSQNASLTVGQCVELQRGAVLVNGAQNGCTGSSVAGVRGTIYTMTVDEDGIETISVYEGKVAVTRRTDEDSEAVGFLKSGSPHPSTVARVAAGKDAVEITDDPLLLAEGQSLTYDPEAESASIRQLTAEDFELLLRGPLITGFAQELPGISNLRDSFRRLFPNIPVPGVPGVSVPSIRLPFPF